MKDLYSKAKEIYNAKGTSSETRAFIKELFPKIDKKTKKELLSNILCLLGSLETERGLDLTGEKALISKLLDADKVQDQSSVFNFYRLFFDALL